MPFAPGLFPYIFLTFCICAIFAPFPQSELKGSPEFIDDEESNFRTQ